MYLSLEQKVTWPLKNFALEIHVLLVLNYHKRLFHGGNKLEKEMSMGPKWISFLLTKNLIRFFILANISVNFNGFRRIWKQKWKKLKLKTSETTKKTKVLTNPRIVLITILELFSMRRDKIGFIKKNIEWNWLIRNLNIFGAVHKKDFYFFKIPYTPHMLSHTVTYCHILNLQAIIKY